VWGHDITHKYYDLMERRGMQVDTVRRGPKLLIIHCAIICWKKKKEQNFPVLYASQYRSMSACLPPLYYADSYVREHEVESCSRRREVMLVVTFVNMR
jgi:hypothetical protein